MFRRLFWLVVGAAFGFGMAFWLTRVIRETIDRYSPERVSADLGDALRQFGSDLRAAVAEGRAGMREREAEIRAEVERGGRRNDQPDGEQQQLLEDPPLP